MSAKLDAALKAFAALSQPERNEFFRAIIENMPAVPSDWMTLDEAAESLEKDKSSISRYIRDGKLISNGKRGGKALRVYRGSVILTLLDQAEKEFTAQFPSEFWSHIAAGKAEVAEVIAKQLAKSAL
jgi:hypothetical protein